MSEAEQKLVAATHDFYQLQLERLEEIKRETGVPKSYLIRQAVDEFIARYERKRQAATVVQEAA